MLRLTLAFWLFGCQAGRQAIRFKRQVTNFFTNFVRLAVSVTIGGLWFYMSMPMPIDIVTCVGRVQVERAPDVQVRQKILYSGLRIPVGRGMYLDARF